MLAIRCTLLRDVFEGGRPDDPRRPEWPPSWMRVFSALVAVAEPGSVDDEVLEALETTEPPAILVGDHLPSRRNAFVPTNAVTKKGGHTVWPGRTNSERSWARVVPLSRHIWYRWTSLELPDGGHERLEQLCRRVPYLGRSTSPAILEVRDDPPADDAWLIPATTEADQPLVTSLSVRSPFPGALADLRDAYDEKHRRGGSGAPWQIGIGVDYGRPEAEPDTSVMAGPYERMIVLRRLGSRVDGRHTARVTHAVRRTLLSRASRHLPCLHGHHDGDVVQCAVVGLPHVGHEHAKGRLLGVALLVPKVSHEDLRVLADALPRLEEELPVTVGPLGMLGFQRLSPVDAARHAWGLQPQRWEGPARRWTSALPVVLDRFVKGHADLEAEVRRAVRNSRLPEPERVAVSRRPFVRGGLDLRARDTLRRPEDRAVKPYRHVVLEFTEKVRGPVVVGSMRHYGLGLCVPFDVDETERRTPTRGAVSESGGRR